MQQAYEGGNPLCQLKASIKKKRCESSTQSDQISPKSLVSFKKCSL